jgi:hydrogenase-4 component E
VKAYVDLALVLVLLTSLYVVYTSRLEACIKAIAVQGAALAILPILHFLQAPDASLFHALLIGGNALLLKAALIPWLLRRAMRATKVRREVEPFVSTHASVLIAAGLVIAAFVLPPRLGLPGDVVASVLYLPVALATLLLGFLVIVSKRTAILQVAGYLMLENGAFVFGQSVAAHLAFVVELGVLLDLLVGVFVMGLVIHRIGREFDHIDVEKLNLLRG